MDPVLERKLLKISRLFEAQKLVLALKREGFGDLLFNHIQNLNKVLQDHERIKEILSADETVLEMSLEEKDSLSQLLNASEEEAIEVLDMLKDYTHLHHSEDIGMLGIFKDLYQATKIFKRRIRRQWDRILQGKDGATKDA